MPCVSIRSLFYRLIGAIPALSKRVWYEQRFFMCPFRFVSYTAAFSSTVPMCIYWNKWQQVFTQYNIQKHAFYTNVFEKLSVCDINACMVLANFTNAYLVGFEMFPLCSPVDVEPARLFSSFSSVYDWFRLPVISHVYIAHFYNLCCYNGTTLLSAKCFNN